jgi:hypothetical protein
VQPTLEDSCARGPSTKHVAAGMHHKVNWPGSQSACPSRTVLRNVSPMHDPPGRSHGRGGGIVSIPSLLGTEPWKLSGPGVSE